jgi:hypothetical protein
MALVPTGIVIATEFRIVTIATVTATAFRIGRTDIRTIRADIKSR